MSNQVKKCGCGHLESEHHELGWWQCDKCSCDDAFFQSSEEKEIEKLQTENAELKSLFGEILQEIVDEANRSKDYRIETETIQEIFETKLKEAGIEVEEMK